MLYLFSGEDTQNKLAAYEEFLKTLSEETTAFFIGKNDFDPAQLENFYSGASLFSAKSAVVLRDILEDEETRELVLSKLKFMGESENLFVFLEGKLKKPVLDAFKKARAELNLFEVSKEKQKKFDNFLIANAFANKDKFHTWLYFRQAVEAGTELEPLAGVLFWKIKDMLLPGKFFKIQRGGIEKFRRSHFLPSARRAHQGPRSRIRL